MGTFKMSARWIDYFESYAMPHDDRSKEYLEPDDFTVKGKFSFLSNKMKFGGKTRLFEKDGSISSAADFTINHNVSPNSSCMYINRPTSHILDGNFSLHRQNDLHVTLYTNMNLVQNEKKRSVNSKYSVRIHHQDNKIFGFGVEDYDPVFNMTAAPRNLTAFGLFGRNLDGMRVFCGPQVAYNLASRAFAYNKFLIGVKNKVHTGYLEVLSNRVVKTENSQEVVSRDNSVALRYDANLSNGKVGADVTYRCGPQTVDAKLFGSYVTDNGTTVRGRIASDRSVNMSIVHNFRGMMNLGFISRFQLNSPSAEGQMRNVRAKFGMIVEFMD